MDRKMKTNLKLAVAVLVALLATAGSVYAADDQVIEVDHLIKCEDGSSLMNAIKDSNDNFARGEVYASIYKKNADGSESGDQTIVIRKPFKVSAPFVYNNPQGAIRVCVTISKE